MNKLVYNCIVLVSRIQNEQSALIIKIKKLQSFPGSDATHMAVEVPNEVLRGGVAMKDACVWQLDKRTSEHKRAHHNMMILESDAFHGSSVQDIC